MDALSLLNFGVPLPVAAGSGVVVETGDSGDDSENVVGSVGFLAYAPGVGSNDSTGFVSSARILP